MGLGPSLHLKPIDNRSEIACNCPFSACKDEENSPYTTLPTNAGLALTNGLLTVHTAVTSAFGMTRLKQLPAHWLQFAEDIMCRIHQKRSAFAIDLAHRLQKVYPEFRCSDVAPGRAFPHYWSCGVLLDSYLSLALGELPPRFHLHMEPHIKLQDIRDPFADVVMKHFPEIMDLNKRCILKKFLKLANDVLRTIAIGEEIGKDDAEVQVNEDDAEFPPPEINDDWFPPIGNFCEGRYTCPHMFCEYHRAHHEF